ncbi:hypothetical protein DPSP01_013582 [Paraphaeosphaeria sporulosa]
MIATTDAVYGPRNPFKDVKIQQACRKSDHGIISLLLKFLPSIFARQTVQARSDITEASHAYFLSHGHEQASDFVKVQYQHTLDQGVTGKDIAPSSSATSSLSATPAPPLSGYFSTLGLVIDFQ